jgi:ankyrin repeat protein
MNKYFDKKDNNLEIAIKSNNYYEISELISNGTNIFSNNIIDNNTTSKTPPYYALCNNLYCYKQFYNLLIELINFDTHLININNPNILYQNINIKLFNIFTFFISDNNNFDKNESYIYYNETSLNFRIISKFISTEILSLITELMGLYKVLYSGDRFKVNINADTSSPKGGNVLMGYFCKIEKYDLNLCKQTVEKMLDMYAWFEESVKCVSLLLNEQFYEIYNYKLNNEELVNIENFVVTTYTLDNLYININYKNVYTKQTILGLTISHSDRPELTIKLLNNGATIDTSYNLLIQALDKKFYKNVKEILSYDNIITTKNINDTNDTNSITTVINPIITRNLMFVEKGKSIYETIVNDHNICISDKLEIVKNLLKKLVLDCADPISIVLDNSYSLDLIKVLINENNHESIKNHVNTLITFNNINKCIQLSKHQELDVLLKENNIISRNNLKFVNAINLSPIMVYLTKIIKNNDDDIETLNILLKYEAEIEKEDSYGNTPLLISALTGKTSVVQKLLNEHVNAFVKNHDGDTCLTLAIKNNRYYTVCVLANVYKDYIDNNNNFRMYLANEFNGNGFSPLMLASQCNYALEVITWLLSVPNIDINYVHNGMNIVTYLLKNEKLTENTKKSILLLLLEGNVDLINPSPVVILAVELNLHSIVVIIMNHLIKINEIDIGTQYNSIEELVNDTNSIKQTITTKNNAPNFYSLVVLYLKNHTEKLQLNAKNKQKINSDILAKIYLTIIICIMYLIYCIDKNKQINNENNSENNNEQKIANKIELNQIY